MRTLALIAAVLIACPIGGAFAETVTSSGESHGAHTVTVHDATTLPDFPDAKGLDEPIFGVKADAPNLIRITDTISAGLEGGKDIHRTGADEGWFTYAKITYTGCLLNCK